MKTKYWTGLEELNNTEGFREAISNEFTREQTTEQFLSDPKLKEANTGRRDFLKFMGFSVAAATLAACETPVVKSIPYVVKPEDITPGIANYYASTYYDGTDYANILVKTREGRPIFIKGNKDLGLGKGSVTARINASVLGLYDGARLRGPRKNNEDTTWETLDQEVSAALASANSIRIVSGTVISPTTRRAVAEFSAKYAGKVKHVQYDAYSYNGITSAHAAAFGKAAVPSFDFSKAKVIVSVGADFLGTWLTTNLFHTGYAENRRPENGWMSKHYQLEAIHSLTGSNADVRLAIKPSQEGAALAALYDAVTGTASGIDGVDAAVFSKMASELKANTGASLVLAGSNDPNAQAIAVAINQALGNYGKTLDINTPMNLFAGNDAEMLALVQEMNAGTVDALIVYGANPSYDWAGAEAFNTGLAKVKTTVSFNLFADETGTRCMYQAPDHHYLESWNDLSPMAGRTDLQQPTINPMYNTRYAQESLLRWAGNSTSYYDYLRMSYNAGYTAALMNSDNTWHMAVHNGTFAAAPVMTAPAAPVVTADGGGPVVEMKGNVTVDQAVAAATASVASAPAPVAATGDVSAALSAVRSAKGGAWEVVLYQKVMAGVGNHANNPVLQETPDPITKVTWDNYVGMAPSDMKEMGLNTYIAQDDEASLVKVTANGKEIILPAFPVPGQKKGTLAISLGYGRGAGNEAIGKSAYQVGEWGEHLMDGENLVPIGKNAFPMVSLKDGVAVYAAFEANVEATGSTYPMATTQMHHTVMGRESVVKETTIGAYLAEKDAKKGEASWNMLPTLPVHEDVNGDGTINAKDRTYVREHDLWREFPVEGVGHRWGLTIDLTSCFGCGACITACHTENNVPVVGKDEVRRHRDMHWLRIDRYFSSEYETLGETIENKQLGTIAAYGDMEIPAENPRSVHMPMMCQHCNHAPCETVCPVAATTHSNEGLNNMAYNRCIGTRYCANNCPYKVRRFNWFNYVTNDKFAAFNPAQDETLRMVLNPDVTVRTRGVMEKCSMCQQRIQEGKLAAKKNGTIVLDGMIETACAEACPTNAIVFGDLNDNASNNTKRSKNNRSYHALEEVGIQPNVFYMTKVRNIENEA
ncbi:MAG: TAT-variant-translocated molybdopterin oxidoreductase [Flavobacteriales bacterium]